MLEFGEVCVCVCLCVCVRERGVERQTEGVCVCSLALTGVSFPGMNNLYSGNHTTLVTLFSRACLHFPHRSTKTISNSSSTYFSLLTVISARYFQSKRGISDRAGTHIDPQQPVFYPPPSPFSFAVGFLGIPFSVRVCRSDLARGYANWSVGVISRWHRST